MRKASRGAACVFLYGLLHPTVSAASPLGGPTHLHHTHTVHGLRHSCLFACLLVWRLLLRAACEAALHAYNYALTTARTGEVRGICCRCAPRTWLGAARIQGLGHSNYGHAHEGRLGIIGAA